MNRGIRVFAFALLTLFAAASNAFGETHETFIEPYRKIDLAPAESGVLAEISIQEGQAVKAGQILASLDKDVLVVSREIATLAAQAKGRYEAAVAEQSLRDERLQKLRDLRSRGHASQDELQRAEAEAAAAQGQRRSFEEQHRVDELEIKKAEAMIERRIVRTPIDGVVTRIHREQGEFVTPIAPTVVTVTQLNLLRAVFNLPQTEAPQLRAGATVMLKVEEREEPVAARVEMVSPIIDADSGTVRVKLVIDNAQGAIHAGRRCFLSLDGTTLENAADATTNQPSFVRATR